MKLYKVTYEKKDTSDWGCEGVEARTAQEAVDFVREMLYTNGPNGYVVTECVKVMKNWR